VRLVGRHVSPLPGPLVLQVLQPDGRWLPHDVPGHGPFDLQIALPASAATADLRLRIVTSGGFIPSQHEAASDDDRRLACRIDDLQLCP
jgi:hypothetical protein